MGRGTRVIIVIIAAIIIVSVVLILLRPNLVGMAARSPSIPSESGSWSVHFCPRENCMTFLDQEIAASSTASCAVYSIDLANTSALLEQKNALVYVDEDTGPWSYPQAIPIHGAGLMHHKFCVLDNNIVTTGSFNPTVSSNTQDNNNLFIIQSPYLHQNYRTEIESLSGKSIVTPYPLVNHSGIMIENYFCPRDNCESHVIDALSQAKHTIYFMTYTFTSIPIENRLISKEGSAVDVRGVIEKFQSANKATYSTLSHAGIPVRYDGNPHLMHHKVFIIDNETVIFGSFNPTKSATTENEENILIVHSANVTQPYLDEWERIWAAALR